MWARIRQHSDVLRDAGVRPGDTHQEPIVPALTHWLAQLNVVTRETPIQIDAYDQSSLGVSKSGRGGAAAVISSQVLSASPSIAQTFLQHLLLVHLCDCQYQSSHSQTQAPQDAWAACEPQSQVAWAASPAVPALTGQETPPTATPFLDWFLICRMGIITAATHGVVVRPEKMVWVPCLALCQAFNK